MHARENGHSPASVVSLTIPAVKKFPLEAHWGEDRRNKKDLKDVWSPFAVVSVFIASLSVGLLSYTHDNFIDRPPGTQPPTSDSVITSLFFISVIFSGVAAMEFTALLLSSTSGLPSTSPKEVDVKSPTAPTNAVHFSTDPEKEGRSRAISKKRRRKQELSKIIDHTTVTSVVLLALSCVTLFAGILTFVWANQPRGVAIAVTVAFGLWCASPLRYVAIFLGSVI